MENPGCVEIGLPATAKEVPSNAHDEPWESNGSGFHVPIHIVDPVDDRVLNTRRE